MDTPGSAVRPGLVLSFDLDETLLDGSRRHDAIVEICREIAARHPELDAAQLVEANAQVWQQYWPEIEDDWTLGSLSGASLRLEAWRRTLAACGCADELVTQAAAESHARLVRQTYRLFDDVPQVLETLRGGHIRTALVTNGASDAQRGKLRALGLDGWFDAVVISGEVGAAKPDPAVFELVLELLAVERGIVWHVGDSLTADVAGANGAGITSVWLNRNGLVRGQRDPVPDIEVASLAHLMSLVADTGDAG